MTGKKVLVVDDEIHIVHVVAVKLRNNGFEVISAQNGGDALELARLEQPDCIVTDFQMPVMSGLELVARLRQQPATSHIPVIMLTARGFDIPGDKQAELNIAKCLSKPFSPRELLTCVEEALAVKAG
jgi:CheY-like chemotaxis protein